MLSTNLIILYGLLVCWNCFKFDEECEKKKRPPHPIKLKRFVKTCSFTFTGAS